MLAHSVNEKTGFQGSYKTKCLQQIILCDKYQTDQEQKALQLTFNKHSKAEPIPRQLPEVWLCYTNSCVALGVKYISQLWPYIFQLSKNFRPSPPTYTIDESGTETTEGRLGLDPDSPNCVSGFPPHQGPLETHSSVQFESQSGQVVIAHTF